jgi:hypothetical protein
MIDPQLHSKAQRHRAGRLWKVPMDQPNCGRALADSISTEQLLDSVVENYFSQIHPWLPMLHENNFRQQFSEQTYATHLEVILHAMVVAAVKFAIPPNTTPASLNCILQLTKRSRDWVMVQTLNSLSVENLQALLIISFSDVSLSIMIRYQIHLIRNIQIGSGEASNAWSIVGSLTRTVEYLQLSVEIEDIDEQPLLKPCPSLPQSRDWTETETRRRVFWNIFNLDR